MSNQNNKIILNDILNYIKKIDNRLIIIEEEVKQNSDDIKLIKEEVKQNSNDIKLIKEEVKQMNSEIKQNSTDIKLIKDEIKQVKQYINKNSKYNEVDVTNWLFNYLKTHKQNLEYYIPSNNEISKNLYNISTNHKKTITDLDGIIIGTNNKFMGNNKELYSFDKYKNTNILYRNTNYIIYDLHIIESKHTLSVSKIRNKIKQIIKFRNIIELSTDKNINKFASGIIYLYFSTPVLSKFLLETFNKQEFLTSNNISNNIPTNIDKKIKILFIETNNKNNFNYKIYNLK